MAYFQTRNLTAPLYEAASLWPSYSFMAGPVTATARQIGRLIHVPDFDLPDIMGSWVSLSDRLISGPVVLSVTNDHWWPFADAMTRDLMSALPWIEALGATLIAVASQSPRRLLNNVELNALPISVVVDDEQHWQHQFRQAQVAQSADTTAMTGPSQHRCFGSVSVINQQQEVVLKIAANAMGTEAVQSQILDVLGSLKSQPNTTNLAA